MTKRIFDDKKMLKAFGIIWIVIGSIFFVIGIIVHIEASNKPFAYSMQQDAVHGFFVFAIMGAAMLLIGIISTIISFRSRSKTKPTTAATLRDE